MRVPVIVMFKDQFVWTKKCIEYLVKNTDKDEYELYLVNNGSTQESLDKIKKLKEFDCNNFLSFENEVGVYYAYNSAIKKFVNTDYFVILHNDVLVSSGWLRNMVAQAKEQYEDFKVCAVYPRTNYTTEDTPTMFDTNIKQIFESYKICNKKHIIENDINNVIEKTYNDFDMYCENISNNDSMKYKITSEIPLFCTLINYNALKKAGMFDNDFLTVHGGNKIFEYQAQREGYFSIHCLNSFVHHNGNTTSDWYGKDFRKDFNDGLDLYETKKNEIEDIDRKRIQLTTKNKKRDSINIAVSREGGIGDIIMSLFSLAGLKDINDNIKITYITKKENGDIFKYVDCVDEVLFFEDFIEFYKEDFSLRNKIDEIFIGKYDYFINLVRIFEDVKREDDCEKHRIEIIKEYVSSILHSIGFKLIRPNCLFNEKNIVYGEYAVIAPKASCEIRSMNQETFNLIVREESKKRKIVIVGKDDIKCDLENSMNRNVINWSGKTSMEMLMSVLRYASVVYTVDSGIFHLASWAGCDCVSFFGSIDPKNRCGYYGNSNRVFFKKVGCAPCFDNRKCKDILCMKYDENEIIEIVNGD